ncbi:MAG: MBL fold metallo-hydrolase [Spirochaetes bacterium]|nr:MBL fold metallo-hydrolase [Spirochaetota bacterium]
MKNYLIILTILLPLSFIFSEDTGSASKGVKMDEFKADKGTINIYFLGHGTLRIDYNKTVIHIDPVKRYMGSEKQPKADIILITHEHSDHLDKEMINSLSTKKTQIVLNQASFDKIKKGKVLSNGQIWENKVIKIEAVPAYNTTEGRDKFHPKGGRDNGYILNIGGKRIYIAGDTEDIPEMANLKNIDIAFLPMNQPYTMTPEQVANAVKIIKPKIVYPYHYSDTKVENLSELMKDNKVTELRIRDLK